MEHASLKAKLLPLLRLVRQAEWEWMSTLSEAEREANGTFERWSAKDLLIHITCWKERRVEMLAMVKRGETPPSRVSSIDELNAQTFAASQDQTFREAQERAERAFTMLVAHTEEWTDEELSDPERFAWLHGNALWLTILAAGIKHPYRHLAEWYLHQGDGARGAHLHEQMVEAMRQVQFPSDELGRAIYHMAGFYVTLGRHSRALEVVTEAIRFQPQVTAWVKQDPTWDALRTLPAFQAISAHS